MTPSTRYAALLRGVNVGGVIVRMADLAETVRGIGFADVRTVLASGNVLFDAAVEAPEAKRMLEAALRDRFGYEAWVHVVPLDEVARIVADYPFTRDREGWHDYAIVVVDEGSRTALLADVDELDPAVESLAPGDGVLYWTVERGRSTDSRLGKNLGRAAHKPSVTTRNLRTLDKLLR
ncbi:MAG: DUF1697 domain-containing protein [Microbacteriaceae bacterium]